MIRLRRTAPAVSTLLVATALAAGALVPASRALAVQVGPDKAEVVLVLDFSASILNDETNRGRFAGALERIADRVDETSRDLIAGDASVSLVQFASSAIDVDRCTGMRLLGSPSTVRRFANCLRAVAGAYRAGIQPALTERIGIDTNYVAAMEQAAVHLPEDAVRPTMIFFSDGRHDVAGVPVTEVAPARDRLFGDRSPFALLPVGMGLEPAARAQLEAGLEALRTIRDMPACSAGSTFEWPQVVFESPDEAGNAVAVALQNATCTFTAAPTVVPSIAPTVVQGIRLQPLDGRIEVSWTPPASITEPIVDYRVRCAAEGEEPIESTEGESLERTAVVEGLTNGTEYRCEVAVVTESEEGDWTPADSAAVPTPRPPPPAKPSVEPLNGAVRVSVAPGNGAAAALTAYRYECSPDNGATWPAAADVAGATDPAAQVGGLTNGTAYVCRAFVANASGLSDASPLSDAVTPCGTFLECSGLTTPILIGVGALLAGAVLLGVILLVPRGRGGYVVAVVDVVHTANLGGGSTVGMAFERRPGGRDVEGIAPARGSKAEVKITRLRGDRFAVRDKVGRRVVSSGESVVVEDSSGVRHELVLRAFEGKAASSAAGRR